MATDPLPAPVNLKLYRGDTRIWEDVFTDVETGLPIDLTGYTFLAQIRSATESVVVECVIAVDIIDAPGGVLRRTLTAAESRKLVGPTAVWDLQSTAPDGFVHTFMGGKVAVKYDTSRDGGVFVPVPGLLSGHGEPPDDTTGITPGSTYLDLDTNLIYHLN